MRDRLTHITVGAVLSICASLPAFAQKSYDERRNEMDAQIDLLRKEKELQDAQRAVAGASGGGLPAVVAIMGIDGRMTARLLQPNGVLGNFTEGETVRPGIVVAAITPRSVAVKVGEGKRARTVPLEFMAGASRGGLPGGPGLPGGTGGGPAVPPELLPPLPSVLPGVRVPTGQPAAPAAPAQPTPAPVAAQPGAAGAPQSAPAPQPAPTAR